MSSDSKNIALVRHVITQVQQNGKFDLIDRYCHPDFVNRTPLPGFVANRDGIHQAMHYLHAALTDIKVDIQHCVCTGDVVATNKVVSGKHVGELLGQPASGQRIEFRVMEFMRVQDEQLIEHWGLPGSVTPASTST
ncbi:hypothetical protein PV04_08417 [Phialophora macrospora]|uniref:SnoaL-like domain-containing protein n=1 Tax=Phialophora macrospora TaxID=1851006 RepID=A0A0D2DVQ6_9EURO|nr:hypothetical protein PV04_08417 [Phialophora macrospora]